MLSTPVIPFHNRLLAGLSSKDRQRLLSDCSQVDLTFGTILCEPGDHIGYAYFPSDTFISLLMPISGGSALEVGLVGNEGMYGTSLLLGNNLAPFRAVVQGSGNALRIDASTLLDIIDKRPLLRHNLKRYLYVTMIQLARAAACNRFHVVEERLARWLLMTRDRAHSDEFHITQEFLSQMLGVRRVGVTKAAGALQNKELISYSRGNIKILSATRLEAASCMCYRNDKEVYDGLLHS